MKLEQGKFCPLIGKDCIGLQCSWFTQIRGNDPQTGKDIDEWGCAVTWMPTLLIENSQQQRQTGAAVESFRNETVKIGEKLKTAPNFNQITGVKTPINIKQLDL
jgi:hypothetical protein